MKSSLGTSKLTPVCISYVPELLPDELIYSWLGRVIKLNSLGYPRDCLEQLFGNRNVIPCIDLPTLLSALHQNLGDNSPFSSLADFIEMGSLYPYHRPFLTPERDQVIQGMMFNGNGKGLKVLMGRVANRFGANPPLRFCKDCVKTDTILYGTPYWKRLHQLPGVTCCLTHNIYLETYTSPNLVIDKQSYVLSPYFYSEHASSIPTSTQIAFSTLSKDVLYAGLQSVNPKLRQRIYKEGVMRAGCYTRRLHQVDYECLASCLKHHYKDFIDFPHQLRLLSSEKHPLCWLRTLIDRPDRSSHPICHLLLIGYLFDGIEEFFDLINSLKSLDTSAYLVPEKAKLEHDDRNKLFRDISLSCRQVAKLLGCSTTTVVCKRRLLGIPINERRKSISIETINSIKRDFSSKLPMKEIALRYAVSMASVYRLRAQYPEMININNDFNLKIKIHRQHWLRLISENPSNTVTSLRKFVPATYAWLYRNDKKWLTNTNSGIKPTVISKQRIDWTKRDYTLANSLNNHIAEIKKLNKRPRISKSFMYKLLGETMVRNNLSRMPKLDKLIQKLTESQIEFQKFRIDCAIKALNKCTKPLSQSYIQRAANIKKWTPELKAYTTQRICSSLNF